VGEAKEQAHFPHRRRARAEIDLLCQLEGPSPGHPPSPTGWGLILRRDEIERKLDHMLEELGTPGPSATRCAVVVFQGRIEAGRIDLMKSTGRAGLVRLLLRQPACFPSD